MFLTQDIGSRSQLISSTLLSSLLMVLSTSAAGVMIGMMNLQQVLGIWVAVALFSLNLLKRYPRWQDRLPLQFAFTLTVQSLALLVGLS